MPLPRLLLLVLLVLACTALGVAVMSLSEREETSPDPVPALSPAMSGPVALLHEWDRRRARAWATGDVDGLSTLYTQRSTAGERDAARLQRWVDRGVRVRRLETQVLHAEVVTWQRHGLVLAVTDRIARAVASGGVTLPNDAPSTWRITLRRVRGEWRVASVRR